MDDQEFKKHSGEALATLYRQLVSAGDDYGFIAAFQSGVISVQFENPPAKFVINAHPLGRQIWVSAHSKHYKLDWDVVENTFVHGESTQTLKQFIEQLLTKQAGEEVVL